MLEAIDYALIDWGWQTSMHQMANKDSLIGLSMVLCLLGLLVIINRLVEIPKSLFLKMGQNTFPIYIIHVIIIYEGLLGIGLPLEKYKNYLTPIQSWMISLFIISWFFVLIAFWEPIERKWQKMRHTIFNSKLSRLNRK
jgi:fucose 4-O-acetylase-like acetyltransferase